MKRALLLVTLVVPSIAIAAEPIAPKLESATAIVDAFHTALKAGDSDRVKTLLDDKVTIYEQGHVESSKDEYAKEHLAADLKFAAATTSAQSARSGAVIGDLAYVITEGRTTGSFEGKPVDSINIETMVLRREGKDWRIVHIHWSSRKAKK